MKRTSSGFTLMEIMVVIIIIAVLASVAGPMITGITDQGKSSATKGSFSNLKTAITNFNADVGHYPHAGLGDKKFNGAYYANAVACGLGATVETNILLSNEVVNGVGDTANDWSQFGLKDSNYQRRWKGPYMDGDPDDFMVDGWGNNIKYGAWKKTIFVHSAGADGSFDEVETIIGNSDYKDGDGDDIVTVIARTRRKLTTNGASDAVGSDVEGEPE